MIIISSSRRWLATQASYRPSLLWPNVWIPTFKKERWVEKVWMRDVPGSLWCALWVRYSIFLVSLPAHGIIDYLFWNIRSSYSCDILSQSKLEGFWPIAFERCREKCTCAFQNAPFCAFSRLKRTLRHPCWFINRHDVV